MQTKLNRICDAIIEAGWLAALVVAPLFFNTFSNRVFEPDKIHLVRSIALLMAVAWLVQVVERGFWRRTGNNVSPWTWVRSTPLVLPALVLVASYLLSTIFSLVPRISLFGSYVRLQGTLTFLSYVTIFGAVLTHLRTRRQVDRLLHAIIVTSLPIALYGVIQQAGLDPLPWGGNVTERVAGNMGNAIFIAAYLIMAVFITLERLLGSVARLLRTENAGLGDALAAGAYLFVLVVQLTTIVFSQSRGPLLGLAAGLYVFAMLGLLLLARWGAAQDRGPTFVRWLGSHVRGAWTALIGFTVAALALLVVLNIPNGPLNAVCQVRYISRSCTVFSLSEGTNAVRALIWEGVVDMMTPHEPIATPDGRPDAWNAIRPLIGYGPESMWVAFNRFYPAALGRIESRSASPDRSHNETFDALVRGGLIQLAAEVVLFGSVFYFALRWLGLIRSRRARNLFVAFLVGGGLFGVLLPLIFDRSLRLAGIGWPAGLIAGLILFVTVDLVLRGRVAAAGEQDAGGRGRQLLILALFAAIVAHFVEVHFGIAIVSTMTHFWVLAAVLVATGMGWVSESEDELQAAAQPAPYPGAPVVSVTGPDTEVFSKRSFGVEAPKGGPKAARKEADARTRKAERRPQPQAAPRPATASTTTRSGQKWSAVLPYAFIMALITAVFVWNYTVNRSGALDPLTVFWQSFTTRTADGQVLRSPMVLILVLFTWLIGGITAISQVRRDEGKRFNVPGAALLYAAVPILTFFIYGLIHASRIDVAGLQGLTVFRHIAGHIVVFDIVLLLLGLALAASLVLARRPLGSLSFSRQPAASVLVAAGLSALAVFLIVSVNIRTVQADMYYKQGLGYEGAGQWEGSVVLYREAARLQPQEDYYYLFLGRGLLQLSDATQPGNPVLPEDLTAVPTEQLLSLVDRAVDARNREDMFRAAHAVLTGARRLNPLNTDHSANLARLHRAWAFTGAVAPGETNDPNRLRDVFQQTPDQVNQARLQRSVEYYRQAVSLSPNNAGLWNELATVQYIQGDFGGALATLDRSLAVDERYYPTHMLRGDVLAAQGDNAAALAAYQKALEISPKNLSVLSAVGVAGVDAGNAQASVHAFQTIVALESEALQNAQAQLDALGDRPSNQRANLERQVARHREQLFFTHRNLALVLRDMGRTQEALSAAQQARTFAPESEQATLDSLIASLQGQG